MNTNLDKIQLRRSPLVRRTRSFVLYAKQHGASQALRYAAIKARAALAQSNLGWKFLYQYNPWISTGDVNDYKQSAAAVWQELEGIPGIERREYELDVLAFEVYVKRAKYERFDPYYQGGDSGNAAYRTEKLLEHYLSLQLISVTPEDVYIDVASNTSPMRHIVRDLYSCQTFSLDLMYKPGIHGDLIGCDGANIPLPDGFASKMTLHCAFEHFADGSDTAFIKECSRILRPGGQVCIIPLYILPEHCIRSDPTLERRICTAADLEGSKLVYVRNYQVPFARFYDPASLSRRIIDHALPLLTPILVRVNGLEQLAPENVYAEFALILEKR